MTGVDERKASARAGRLVRVRDTRPGARALAAVLMPIGPAMAAVVRFFAQDDAHVGERLASDPASQAWLAVPGWIILFTLVPGVYAALRLTRRRSPVLTLWTGALLVPAYLGMTALGAVDAAAYAGLAIGLPPQTASALATAAFGAPTVALPVLVFVVGHITGTVLLGVLVVRARLLPVGWGVAIALSQPVHLVATILGLPWIDLIGWGTTAAGMAALARVALRTPDDEWDLPPLPPTR